ncbi:hypothetical protein AB0J71_47830 [Nonomuraea sp. NPDC049637]|uniref:hypothetical protein n=1 Tax=Nonomuraea sp. NPDC049637 TaxID=3154356 RepID=UPI0034440228
MLRRFIPAAVAAASLAGLAFASPASAASLPDRMYGCARGDFCMYWSETLSEGSKIGIGRGEDYGPVTAYNSEYRGVRSFFNYGWPADEDHVVVTYAFPDGITKTKCVHRAEDKNVLAGYEVTGGAYLPATVIYINWVNSKSSPCNG